MPPQQHVLQRAGTVRENAVRMDADKAGHVVEALNLDLSGTFVLYHQLRKHQWTVGGRGHRELARFLRGAADETVVVIDDLAERIAALGGVPQSGPAAVERQSHVPFEGEDVYDGRTALENDRRAYGDLIEQLSSHVEMAESYGDHVTGDVLRYQLAVFEDHVHVLDRFLREDSPTPP